MKTFNENEDRHAGTIGKDDAASGSEKIVGFAEKSGGLRLLEITRDESDYAGRESRDFLDPRLEPN